MFICYFVIIAFFIAVFFKSKRSLHMLQQNLYNENNRYLKWVKKNYTQFFGLDIVGIIFALIGVFVIYDLDVITYIILSIITVIYLYIGRSWNLKIKNDQNKKPLVVTKRVRRLIITTSVLYFIPTVLLILKLSNVKFVWYMILVLTVMIYLNQFVVFIANIINHPIERGVYHYYKSKAQSKLRSMPNLKIIGITGSYGKTSSKNIINDILNVKFNSIKTPKSFNTPYGLISSINNNLDKFSDIFIAEMGAFKVGDIKQTCKIVNPKYGIITKIGEAHLESFKTKENIMKGKFELVESLPSSGLAILNGDDPYQLKYEIKNNCNVKWIGIDNNNVDLCALNIKLSDKGTTFDCKFKNDKELYTFNTKLLGKHNVYNILAGILLGHELGLTINELQRGVSSIKTIEHRLELKKYGNINIIDDAYNSNPIGSKMALDVLNLMDGTKIIVTPGMIELGNKQYELNKKFGEYISEVCDYVILIGKNQTKPIYDGLIEKKYDAKKIFILNDVRDAFVLMNKLSTASTYVLLENDLPDLFNE